MLAISVSGIDSTKANALLRAFSLLTDLSRGVMNLLDVEPTKCRKEGDGGNEGLHDRTCVFLGCRCDKLELESYVNMQQRAKMY